MRITRETAEQITRDLGDDYQLALMILGALHASSAIGPLDDDVLACRLNIDPLVLQRILCKMGRIGLIEWRRAT